MSTQTTLILPTGVVETTLQALRQSGERSSEGIVLWLGKSTSNHIEILEAFVPEHVASIDYFRISPLAMDALFAHLAETGTFVAAQVHSHPREAFHSQADDEWAIIRHANALSVVVPHFARETITANFLEHVAVFKLSAGNRWLQLDRGEAERILRLS